MRRYFSWRNFVDPIFVIMGFFQALAIIFKFKPDVIFSKGGYVALPVTFAAWMCRKPVILHESDGRMGLANRIASKFASKICVAFPDLANCSKCILTGNPIRSSILNGDKSEGYKLTGFNAGKAVLLVWGGSLGAQKINELLEKNFEKLKRHFQIVHITGKGKGTNIQNENYCTFEYINEELKHIYAITDFVVGRAGANSIYEVALMEKPNMLLPLKNADQQKNAAYFEKTGASIILHNEDRIYDTLVALLENKQKQEDMKEALRSVSRPNAVKDIAKLILE